MRWVNSVSPVDGRERAGALRDGAIHGVREIDLLAGEGSAVRPARPLHPL
jgi:hypothetical protein